MPTIVHRNLPKLATVAAGLVIAAFALACLAFYQGHSAGCGRTDVTLNVVRDLLVAAQMQTDADPTVPQFKKDASDAFIASALARIDQARC